VTSSTYVYTYIAFALVYLVSSLALTIRAYRASGAMSRAGSDADPEGNPTAELAFEYVDHGQRLIDIAQLAMLLPLAYIVGSIFLGSTILRDQSWAGTINSVWIGITFVAIAASILLAVKATKEAHALSEMDAESTVVGQQVVDATRKLASRLGISTTLLAMISLFILANLWSVLSNLDTLLNLDYVL